MEKYELVVSFLEWYNGDGIGCVEKLKYTSTSTKNELSVTNAPTRKLFDAAMLKEKSMEAALAFKAKAEKKAAKVKVAKMTLTEAEKIIAAYSK